MRNNGFKFNKLAFAITASSLVSVSAIAQEIALEEVIVTANARAQAVEDIPYNISAINGDSIEAMNISTEAELLRSMAGVSVIDRGHRNSGMVNSIIIRGLNVDSGGNGDIALNAVPTVSTYIDNTPMYANFIIRDMERVEVLRGPQGTLYGSGALGGTVKYVSNKPSTEGFSAKVSADYGQTEGSNGDNKNIDLMVNIPLGDSLAIRASGGQIDNDGVIDYINAYKLNAHGEPLIKTSGGCQDPRTADQQDVLYSGACYESVEDADTVEIDYSKIALRWTPSDETSLQFTYQSQSDEIGARRATTLGHNNQPASSGMRYEYGEYDSGQVLLEPSSRDADLLNVDFQTDMGFATLSVNASSYETEGVGDSDNGGLWVSGGQDDPNASRDWIDAFWYAGWPRPAQRAERGYTDETTVYEIKLVSNSDNSSIDWLVGAFKLDQDQTVYQNSWNPGMNEFNRACVATAASPACDKFWPAWVYSELSERDFEYRRDVVFEETALFGEATYHIGDSLHITAGFRWFDNSSTNHTIMGFPLGKDDVSPEVPMAEDSDDDILWKFNVAFDLSDNQMAYATYSQGYRRSGANAVPSVDNGDPFGEPNAQAIRAYASDSVDNYEIGLKGHSDRLSYTASFFYVDWNTPQLNTTTAWYGFFVAANGASANTYGFESDLNYLISDNLSINMGYTYVNAELDEDFISPQTDAVVAPTGSTLPGTPENMFSANLTHHMDFGGGWTLQSLLGVYYQSEAENFINKESSWAETFESFALWNGSVSLINDHWSASLYVKNLTNEKAVTGSFPESHWSYDTGIFEEWYGNGNRQFITQPRTVGLKLSYQF